MPRRPKNIAKSGPRRPRPVNRPHLDEDHDFVRANRQRTHFGVEFGFSQPERERRFPPVKPFYVSAAPCVEDDTVTGVLL